VSACSLMWWLGQCDGRDTRSRSLSTKRAEATHNIKTTHRNLSLSPNTMASSLTLGRGLFFLGNLFYTAGSFYADWNVTHIHNPKWPPHAKFHNGQTMSLGVLLALTSTYFAFRPAFSHLTSGEAKHSVLSAAVIGSMYCAAGISAIFYPGTHWFDPEYEMKGPTQREIFGIQVVVMWVAYYLEVSRIGKAKSA
jgi:hypothetical protein